MVAVALLAVIIVGLLAMFYQVQRAFRAGTAQVDIMEGGRATMNLLVRDLQEMTACQLREVTNCAIVPSWGAALILQDLPTGSARSNYLHDLCFLSRVNDLWMGTAYRMSNAVSGVGTLYRVVESTNSQTLFPDQSNALVHVSRLASDTGYGNPVYHRLLDGVVNFTVTSFDINGISYLTHGDTNNYHLRFNSANDVYAFMADQIPAYLDIELAVLEPSALAKFRVREEIGPAQAAEYLARQIGATHVFRQRVAIRPAATDVGVRY